MSQIEFDAERLARFNSTVAKYEKTECALLPTLYMAQEQFGALSAPVLEYIAKLLDIPPGRVFAVVSFYNMFKEKGQGKWCIQICGNITCSMMNAKALIRIAEEELGIKLGEMTNDKKFSLEKVECIGACDRAPVIQVNGAYHERLNEQSFRELIRTLKDKTATPEVSQ